MRSVLSTVCRQPRANKLSFDKKIQRNRSARFSLAGRAATEQRVCGGGGGGGGQPFGRYRFRSRFTLQISEINTRAGRRHINGVSVTLRRRNKRPRLVVGGQAGGRAQDREGAADKGHRKNQTEHGTFAV
jgi:hypothetical protein